MLWPLPGVVQSERLDEVIVDRRAVRARHFATVVAVEVESLVRHHQRFLAAVALWAHGHKNTRKLETSETTIVQVRLMLYLSIFKYVISLFLVFQYFQDIDYSMFSAVLISYANCLKRALAY